MDEFIQLAKIFAAADHGSYLLEPCRVIEIMGLWKELQHVWDEKTELKTRYKQEKFLRQYLTSRFPESQIAIYGELLKMLKLNPFYDQPITVEDTFKNIDALTERLLARPQHDALIRFEGFFSPTQLIELANKLGVSNQELVKKAIIDYSSKFSQAKIHSSGEFTALATNALVEIYMTTPDKKNFFVQAFTIIAHQMREELSDDGTFNLHIAPFAYLQQSPGDKDIKTFIENIKAAYQQVFLAQLKPNEKSPPKPTIYFTLREDKNDFNYLEELITAIKQYQTTPLEGVEFYLSFGGQPYFNFNFETHLNTCLNRNINVIVHIGLQEEATIIQRLNNLLSIFENPETNPDRKEKISIHIDNQFNVFLNWFEELDETEKKIIREHLKISFSPLQYILLNPKQNYNILQKFIKTFPQAQIGTNNASQIGDLGISAQYLLFPQNQLQ